MHDAQGVLRAIVDSHGRSDARKWGDAATHRLPRSVQRMLDADAPGALEHMHAAGAEYLASIQGNVQYASHHH